MMILYSSAQQRGDLTEAEVKETQKSSYPLFISRDPDTGKIIAISPGSVDSFLDTTTWAIDNFNKVGRAFGQQTGRPEDVIAQKINPMEDLENSVGDFFEKVYLSDAVKSIAFGIDPKTDKPYRESAQNDTLLNIEMPKRLRDALVTTVPYLKSLDKKLPASIVGATTVTDPVSGEVLREGTPGIFGNVPTGDGGIKKGIDESDMNLAGYLAKAGGLTLMEIDPEANLIQNYQDFTSSISDIRNAIQNINDKLNLRGELQENGKLREQKTRLLQLQGLLEYNQLQINRLAVRKGYTLPVALRRARQLLREEYDKGNSTVEFLKTLGEQE